MEKGLRIAEGRTAEVFAWGEQDVLKLFRAGWPPEQAKYEAAMAETLYAAGVPSPATRGLVEVDGRSGVVYERVAGPSLEQMVLSQPWRLPRAARILAETQAADQACAVPNSHPGAAWQPFTAKSAAYR